MLNQDEGPMQQWSYFMYMHYRKIQVLSTTNVKRYILIVLILYLDDGKVGMNHGKSQNTLFFAIPDNFVAR